VRGGDGQVRVLYNTCTHRGARVCRRDESNAAIFQCFYHATVRDWSIQPVALPVRLRYHDSESRLPEHRVKRYDLLPRPS
jgi:p-cumate 2,3-dioxygenase subunit alpha